MNLPPAPVKAGDTRSANWNGLGQVELDAIEPSILQTLCSNAIENIFNEDTEREIRMQEDDERREYRTALKEYITTL